MTQPQFEVVDRGSDRITVHRYPDPAPTAPLVVIWPAMGVPARFYKHFVAALQTAGLGVAVVDLRGTGASTPAPSHSSRYGYADLASDVGAVLDAVASPGRPTILLGHSLGGQVCALHLALTADPRVNGLALVAVGLPYFRSYGLRGLGVLGFSQGIAAISALLRVWPGWGFGGRQARGVMRDWGYTARHGRFPRIRGIDPAPALASVRTPVLAVSVDQDQYTPAVTLDHLCQMLSSAPTQRVHLTVSEVDGPLDHFLWARSRSGLAERIAQFARSVAAGAPLTDSDKGSAGESADDARRAETPTAL